MVNATVKLYEGELAETALKRLKKELARGGTFAAMKRHESYRKPSVAKRIKSLVARAKVRKSEKRVNAAMAEHEVRR